MGSEACSSACPSTFLVLPNVAMAMQSDGEARQRSWPRLLFTTVSLLLFSPTATASEPLSSPRIFKLRALNLFPESFDWDSTHSRLLLSSAAHGTIWAFYPDKDKSSSSSVQEVVRDEEFAGKVAFGGVIVDRGRGRVVVAMQDFRGNFGALAAFDLFTGKRVFLARLDDVGVGEGEKSCANDVAVDFKTGTAYVTNCIGNFLWQVTKEGLPSVFVKHELFTSQPSLFSEAPWCGFNGIVYDQQRHLLAVQTNSGALFRINVGDQSVHLVRMDENLVGADGMVFRDDGALVVVSQEKLWLVRTSSDWTTANVVDTVKLNGSNYATGAANVRGTTFFVNAHLPDLFANRSREEFEVVEVEFPSEVNDLHPVWLLAFVVVGVGGVALWRVKMGQFYQRKRV